MIKKILLILLLFSFSLQANTIHNYHAVYTVKLGILGHIGTINLTIRTDEKNYKIEITGKTEGIAKIFGTERSDKQVSKGVIVDGYLVPLEYTKSRETFTKKRIKRYIFDHKNRMIFLHQTKIVKEKNISALDILSGKSLDDIEYTVTKSEKKEKVDKYTRNDLLTLFFNLKKILNNDLDNVKYTKIYVAGTSKKDKYIKIYTPKKERLLEARKELGDDGHILALDLNQKIFISKHGNLLLKINDEGICTKAVLKDIIFGGDVVMELKKINRF
jgi:hypothetical protein